MSISCIVGTPVTGDNFSGRKKEIQSALEKLRNGNSLILSAPRRVGKTSFSKKLIEVLEQDDWMGIYINMEHLRDEMELYNELAGKLYEKRSRYEKISRGTKQLLEQVSFSIKDTSIKFHDETARNSIRTDILRIINDPERCGRIVFVFDELAVFLNEISEKGNNPKNARSFLSWLRSVRQESSEKAVWVFCSSISIENYLFSNDLSSTTNDMLPFVIGEMPECEALDLIQKLSAGSPFTISVPIQKYILGRLGVSLPHNIQAIFSQIMDDMPEGKTVVTKAIVNNAYDHLVKNATYFGTWYQRLKDYPEGQELKRILHYMCSVQGGVTDNQLAGVIYSSYGEDEIESLAKLLRILQHDGYIIKDLDNRYSFRLNLLRDYWNYYNL